MQNRTLVVAALAIAPLVYAQQPATTKIEPKLLEEDLRIARGALETGHSGIYRYTPKAELDKTFDAMAKQISGPMTPMEFYRLLAPITGAIKCGHTAVNPPRDVQQATNRSMPLFPLDVEVLAGRVYVYRDYSPDDHGAAGQEVRRINGVAIDAILSKMFAAISGDGDSQTAKPWRIGHGGAFPRLLYSLAAIESPFQVEFRDPANGKSRELTLAGVIGSDRQKIATSRYQDKCPDNSADLKFLEDGKIAVLTVYGFGGRAGPAEKKPLNQYFDDAFGEIHTRNSPTLILDVRNNGGGADELGKQLLSFLLDQPFQYYDDLIFNAREFDFFRYVDGAKPIPENVVEKRADDKYHNIKHPNWGLQQPRAPHFAGRVLVLMNGGSFSTTCEFLSNLHYRKRATFIGQEAAGGYYGNSSGAMAAVMLPNSKVMVRVPLMTYYLAVKGADPKRSILPDYDVAPTIQDLLSGNDTVMAKALDLAHGQ
ncbi:MAG TPA: S41 family peptidase [Bryobacteraceae bacterium]|nr:S41 family peptidase [Bryobacteraceae bacterium]